MYAGDLVENKLKHLFNGKIKTLFIVRHPEVENHTEGIFNGTIDVGLSKNGIKQARKLHEFLKDKNITTVLSSPMRRCRIVAEQFKDKAEVVYDDRLRERSFGIFESLNWQQITEKYPYEAKRFLKDPFSYKVTNGESFENLKKRLLPFINDKLINLTGNTLIVAHGGVNRIIISQLLLMKEEAILRISQSYACLNTFETDGTFFLCKLLNGSVT